MAVRLAVKAALAPFGVDAGALPTMAGDRIFDSRLDLLDGRGGERTPLIVFAVEAIDGLAFSEQNGARGERGFNGSCRIVISAQVTSRQVFLDTDTNTEFEAEAADLLDHELADILDIVQDQAWAVLQQDPLFGRVAKRVTKLDAEPYPSTETGEKLAVLANSYFVEPLADGVKALEIVRDGLPQGSPVRARAAGAIAQIEQTAARLAAARLARSGLVATAPFSASGTAQGAAPPVPPPPPAATEPAITVTLDPKDPAP